MKIAVAFGSRSPEHDVSIVTGQLIISELKKMSGYDVVPLYLGKDGAWYAGDELGKLGFFKTDYTQKLADFGGWQIDTHATGKLVLNRKKSIFNKNERVEIDFVFPAFHGAFGEDGTAQGLFEMIGVPYASCDTSASAITMDKILTKDLLKSYGIPVTPYVAADTWQWQADKNAVIREVEQALPYPVFIKPARLGSSIGITKASNRDALSLALETAFCYDTHAIVENFIPQVGDLTVAILGGEGTVMQASLIQESVFTGDHFSYADKYLNDGGAQIGNATQSLVIPADLGAELSERVTKIALETFQKMRLSGNCRVDFLLDRRDRRVFVSEINTLPGTLYHHLWKKSGVELSEVISRMIALGEARAEAAASRLSSFESSLLDCANSQKLGQKMGN